MSFHAVQQIISISKTQVNTYQNTINTVVCWESGFNSLITYSQRIFIKILLKIVQRHKFVKMSHENDKSDATLVWVNNGYMLALFVV